MDMVRSDVYGEKRQVTFDAKISNRYFDGLSILGVKRNWLVKQQLFAMLPPVAVWLTSCRAVFVIIAINAAAFVAVEPCSVTPKGEENSERDVCVVPH
jgi:hypothetical protein